MTYIDTIERIISEISPTIVDFSAERVRGSAPTILDLYAQLKMNEGNSSKIIDKLNDIFQSYIA